MTRLPRERRPPGLDDSRSTRSARSGLHLSRCSTISYCSTPTPQPAGDRSTRPPSAREQLVTEADADERSLASDRVAQQFFHVGDPRFVVVNRQPARRAQPAVAFVERRRQAAGLGRVGHDLDADGREERRRARGSRLQCDGSSRRRDRRRAILLIGPSSARRHRNENSGPAVCALGEQPAGAAAA